MTQQMTECEQIMATLELLPVGNGFSCYHDSKDNWVAAYHGQRFSGSKLLNVLGQVVTYVQMEHSL